MKKLFVLTDIHSFYELARDKLDEAGFDIENPDHILVHCGDLLDRGPDSLKCLEMVNSIPDDRKIMIYGNHEELMIEMCHRGYFMSHDVHNGTVKSVAQIAELPYEDVYMYDLTAQTAMAKTLEHPEFIKYRESWVNYAIVGQYVFVHGWIPGWFRDGMPVTALDRVNGEWVNGHWKDARWANGMKEWSKGNRLLNKTIVCGHYHASWGHYHLHHLGVEFADEYYEDQKDPDLIEHFEPFIDEGIIALDACTAYSEQMNCVLLEVGDEEWQSRTLGNIMNA